MRFGGCLDPRGGPSQRGLAPSPMITPGQSAMSLAVLAAFAVLAPLPASADLPGPVPVPARYGDFDHDTLALTWQPGFCASGPGCLPDQPRGASIGLHGLWASRPSVLRRRGVAEQRWWREGCDDLGPHASAPPALSPLLRSRIEAVMPHLRMGLLAHEYAKHVACFGFAPEAFFAFAIAMRDAVAFGPFGTWLRGEAGHAVRHADAAREFERDFHTPLPRAVQFRCDRDRGGRVVLTQMSITLRPDRLAEFPQPETLRPAPIPQDNCPAEFAVPSW